MGGASPFVPAFLSLVLLVSLMPTDSIRTTVSVPSKPKRLVFNLVHSNPTLSTNDLEPNGILDDDPLARLVPMNDVKNLFVSFGIGEPPIPQLAIFDTGSNRKWIMCGRRTNIFDPSQSTTFKRLPCQDSLCPPTYNCPTPNSPCSFSNKYASGKNGAGVSVSGVLATEHFTFETYDDGITQVPQVLFGCVDPSTNDDGSFSADPRFNGVFGIADIAFLANVGGGHPRFSYCIGDLTNPKNASSYLHLGEDVELDGAITSLRVGEVSHFSVVVNSIFLGDEDLYIDPHYFIIDTGATYTFFSEKWYYRIEDKIRDVLMQLGFEADKRTTARDASCYRGSLDDLNSKGFPSLSLHFGDQVEMLLNPANLFYQMSVKLKVFCLAIKLSSLNDTGNSASVLGLWTQQGFNMGFDAASKKFYFYETDCRGNF